MIRLKCDRQQPCTSCSKRGDDAACNYSTRARGRRNEREDTSRTSEANIRLKQLEQMVSSLMQQTTTTNTEPKERLHTEEQSSNNFDQRMGDLSFEPTPPLSETTSEDRSDVQGSKTNYLGATNWTTVLDSVSGASFAQQLRTILSKSDPRHPRVLGLRT